MKRTLLAVPLFLVSLAASAGEGISYNHVEGGYLRSDADDYAPDADGWSIRGSAAVASNLHVFGDYAKTQADDYIVWIADPSVFQDVDGPTQEDWRIGLGYNHELAPNVDAIARLAYRRVEHEWWGSDDGYQLEAGIRAALAPTVEGYALVGYDNVDTRGDSGYGKLGMHVKFNDTWGVNTDVKLSGGQSEWFIGPRISF